MPFSEERTPLASRASIHTESNTKDFVTLSTVKIVDFSTPV